MKKAALLLLIVAAWVALLLSGRLVGISLSSPQIESLTIFAALIWGILLYENFRLTVVWSAVAAVVGFGLLSPAQFVSAMAIDVILFLLGTFLVAAYLEEALFFEHLASQIVRRVGPRPDLLIAVLMLAALISSAVVGEVAAILFVGGAMIHIANRYKLQPIPFLIMLVFATNTGSAASAFGPVGVTIAIKAKLTVLDFFRWATPISLVVLVLVFFISRWYFAPAWKEFAAAVHRDHLSGTLPDPGHGKGAVTGWILVAAMSALLVFHSQVEQWLHLPFNSMLVGASLGAGAVSLCLSGRRVKHLLIHRVDWWTLAFFMGLFIVVGGLEATGVTNVVAAGLMRGTRGNPAALTLTVGWSTGFLSAFVANLLAVAAFLPIIAQVKAHGVACPTCVYWLMLFGATFMGNMTSVGSACNIIACGMADKRGHGTIYFAPWLKVGIIISLASMGLATLLLAIQTGWLTRG
ncbi:MAG TPA: SLC13 family permease [Tepidisphaeraceae bacterium]|nr:SLC13 family permease [Tepidisphaeraceae bacterium]